MKITINGLTYYVRDTCLGGFNHYLVNTGEFTDTLFETTCQGRDGWQQIYDHFSS